MRRKVAAAVLAVSAALYGCGGTNLEFDRGGSTVASTTGSAAVSTFTTAADRICTQVSKRFGEAQRQAPRSFEQSVQIMDALIKIAQQGDTELAQLSPPAEQAADYERYLRARQQAASFLEQARTAASNQDAQAYDDARTALNNAAGERRDLAAQAGLQACAAAEGS